jgi:hypothetical protein
MIRIQQGVNRDIWWVSPYNGEFHNIDSYDEPPSTQEDRMVVGNLQDALPPLLYERYCILKLAHSCEWVEGVGKIFKYRNGGCQVFIFEEE